jgi:hypothetical protein
MKVLNMFVLLGAIVFTNLTHAQVGGISASKVGTFCAGTVPGKDLEFEPSYSFAKSTKQWDSDNKLVNKFSTTDSAAIASELAIRCTYGFSDKLEIGISVPSDVSWASIGAKFNIWSRDHSGVSFIAGINLPMGNRVYSDKSYSLNDIGSFAGGIVISHQFSEKVLWDIDIQGQKLFRSAGVDNHSDLFINTDIGFYPKEHIQLICGMGYYNLFYRDANKNVFMIDIHPGISYETGENFLIVISSLIGLYGKNEHQWYGVNFAFAMTIR